MTRNLPLWGGGLAGGLTALAFLILPAGLLEDMVMASGVAALLPAAAPPLGVTARAVLGLGGGAAVLAVTWSALYLLFGPGGMLAGPRVSKARGDGIPTVRRADAHPDAPPRRPLTAADLGGPMPAVQPIGAASPPEPQPLPRNLDQPLAAFDPAAVPDVPREPVRAVAPLARTERLETFVPSPPVPPASRPVSPAPPQSIEALLRRLEEGASRRSRMPAH